MQLDLDTFYKEVNKSVTKLNLEQVENLDQYDNCDLMQLLYACLGGGDHMPQQQQERFRKLYWEIFDRFAE